MHFLTSVWIFQVTGIVFIAISETTVVHPPGPIRAFYGETVNFTWTSDGEITEATWGIRSGSTANPQYIFVDDTGSPPVISVDKSGLHFIGNLTAGQAWFALSNATASDSNTYIGLILEKGSTTQPYYVQVILGPRPTSRPSTTPSSTSDTMVPGNLTSTTKSPTTNATSTKRPTTSPTGKPGLSVGATVGIVIGSVIGVGCIIIVIVVIVKKSKKSKQDNPPADKKQQTEMNPA